MCNAFFPLIYADNKMVTSAVGMFPLSGEKNYRPYPLIEGYNSEESSELSIFSEDGYLLAVLGGEDGSVGLVRCYQD